MCMQKGRDRKGMDKMWGWTDTEGERKREKRGGDGRRRWTDFKMVSVRFYEGFLFIFCATQK